MPKANPHQKHDSPSIVNKIYCLNVWMFFINFRRFFQDQTFFIYKFKRKIEHVLKHFLEFALGFVEASDNPDIFMLVGRTLFVGLYTFM